MQIGPGARFGALIVLRQKGSSRYGRVWLCRCDCGRKLLRLGPQLRYAVKQGQRPSCLWCRTPPNRAPRETERRRVWKLRVRYEALWRKTGQLYDEHWERQERAALRRLFEVEPEPLPPGTHHVAEPADEGSAEYYAASFSEIATALGISRERVRQLYFKALEKLRMPARLNILREFTEHPPPRLHYSILEFSSEKTWRSFCELQRFIARLPHFTWSDKGDRSHVSFRGDHPYQRHSLSTDGSGARTVRGDALDP